jgi:uncharacterized protein YneF (UPF0154 family)
MVIMMLIFGLIEGEVYFFQNIFNNSLNENDSLSI